MATVAAPLLVPTDKGARNVRVFVSHKHDDSSTALKIKNWFEELGGGRLDVHVSELIPRGKQWDEQIRQWLRQSDWLLLLYTGPGDWDWCLYETGFFAGAHEPTRRLVCIHRHGVELPDPLRGWQATTEKNFEGLLDEIFRKEPFPGAPALNPRLRDERLNDVAHEIMDGFVAKGAPVEFTPHFELKLETGQKTQLVESHKLADRIVVTADLKAREIFGLRDFIGPQELHWSDIRLQLEASRQGSWIRGLEDSLRRLCQNQRVSTSLPVLYSGTPQAIRRWRSILHGAQIGGTTEEFQIIFSEIMAEDDPRPQDPRLDHCMSLLRMSRMIRFGLVEKYGPVVRKFQNRKKLQVAIRTEELDEELGALPAAIERIETDTVNSGVRDPDNIVRVFGDSLGDNKLEDWTKRWVDCRQKVITAVGCWDLDALQASMDSMRQLSVESYRAIARAYCEMIEGLR